MRNISVALSLPETEIQPSEAFLEARRAAEHGWSVIPVIGKKPDAERLRAATGAPSWKPFQTRQATVKQFSHWRDAEAFGLVTGPVSGLIALDIDPGGREALTGLHLPETVTANTPRGGYHYLYKQPARELQTGTDILGKGSHVDLRATGGYVVLCGSQARTWVDGLGPDQVTLAPCPDWLLKAAKTKTTKPEKTLTDLQTFLPLGKKEASIKYGILASPTELPTPLLRLKGQNLTRWFSDQACAVAMARSMGIDAGYVGQGFCDVLPSRKPDTNPSAALYQHETGQVLYRSWRPSVKGWYTLSEVRASLAYKKPVKLVDQDSTGRITRVQPEHVCWGIRLMTEAGLTAPADVPHRPLPPGAPKAVAKVYAGFLSLLGCKWRHTPGDATPFSWRFASAWCGVGQRQAGDAIQWLLSKGFLVVAGKHRRITLFLPRTVNERR